MSASTSAQAMKRRDFLRTGAALGGGLLISLYVPEWVLAKDASAAKPATFAPNAFVRIGTDDIVTVIVNKSEMGQGVYTSLPMLVAEELEADWSKVRYESAPVDAAYNHTVYGIQMTGGSTSTASEWERLRKAGATARVMLIAAAAQKWNVSPETLRADNGFVINADHQAASFGSLAELAATMTPPKDVHLKDPKNFRLIGKATRRLDTPAKTNGSAQFGLDVAIPGMMTVLIARAPVFGGQVVSFNAEKSKAVAGVKDVLQVPSGIAVIANGFWAAKQGRDKLEIKWDEGSAAEISTKGMREQFAALARTPGAVARKVGDPVKALAGAAKTITAEYEVPFLAHASMEPLNCVVDLRADHCEIWTGTQFQTVDRMAAAAAAGLKPEQVEIHTTFLGGGFGRRANPASDFIVEAVQVAKAAKVPVKVIWTREDDTRGGWYRPMWYDRFVGGLDAQGNPLVWNHTIVGQSITEGTLFAQFTIQKGIDSTSVEGAADLLYGIPNLQVDLHTPKIGVPVQWWRSVGHSHNGFAVEAFFDEMAHAGGKDPYELRRTLLGEQPRMRAVLDLVAQKADWGKPLPAGRGRGIATHFSFDSYVAQVADVSVDKNGAVRVHRVICAVDCGRVVNPDSVKAQMEGGINFGLTAALKSEITLANGRVQQRNFHDYEMLRINEAPKIEVYIVPSDEKPTGVGEPSVPPVAPAVANAIFAVTGKRVRKLPIRRVDLS